MSPEQHSVEGHFRILQEYRVVIRHSVAQGLVDIMLKSVSTSEVLTLVGQRQFYNNHITPAILANNTTDTWLAVGGNYPQQSA